MGWHALYDSSYLALLLLELWCSRYDGKLLPFSISLAEVARPRASRVSISSLHFYEQLANSKIQYTYYTITAFRIRVPKAVKQTLTTLQICQFVIGVYYAAAHSFISYDIPVTSVQRVIVDAAETINNTTAGQAAQNAVKSIIYRAAGAEGLAEAVGKASESANAVQQTVTGYRTINCLDTNGQTFATWLNVFYLGPLMYLFMRFFYRSYIRRTQPKKGKTDTVKAVEGAVVDAAKGADRALNGNSRSRK